MWLIDVDMTVGEWEPDGDGALDRLHRLRDRRWTPDDVDTLDGYSEQIAKWTVAAVELLGDRPPEVALRLPCPSCGRKFVYRRSGGETVRSWALRVSEAGARCQGCDATWKPENFAWLAKVLGCPALPVD